MCGGGATKDEGALGRMFQAQVQFWGPWPLSACQGKEPKGYFQNWLVLSSTLEGWNKLMFVLIIV